MSRDSTGNVTSTERYRKLTTIGSGVASGSVLSSHPNHAMATIPTIPRAADLRTRANALSMSELLTKIARIYAISESQHPLLPPALLRAYRFEYRKGNIR